MIRTTALLFALLMSGLTVSSACVAEASSERLGFTLSERRGDGQLEARFRRDERRNNHDWTSSFTPAQLAGFDLAGFRAAGTRPLRFALNRDSGRLDCAGTGGGSRASGDCTFAPAPAFASKLTAGSIAAPDRDEWLGLFALDVPTALVDAVRAAGYPAPTIDQLMAMTAVGVTSDYIRDLAAHGYRPERLDALVELKAVGVDSRWIGEMAGVGYARLPGSKLLELRALGVDAAYIRSFQQAGYRNLSTSDLTQLKALDVTADFARGVESSFGRQSPAKLVEMKALGFAPRQP